MSQKRFLYVSALVFAGAGILLSGFIYSLYGADSPGMYLLVSFVGAVTLVPSLLLLGFAFLSPESPTGEESSRSRMLLLLVLLGLVLAVFFLRAELLPLLW